MALKKSTLTRQTEAPGPVAPGDLAAHDSEVSLESQIPTWHALQ